MSNISWSQSFSTQIDDNKKDLKQDRTDKKRFNLPLNFSKKLFIWSIILFLTIFISSILTTVGLSHRCKIEEKNFFFGLIWRFEKDNFQENVYKAYWNNFQYAMLIFNMINIVLSIYTIFLYVTESRKKEYHKKRRGKIDLANYCFSIISNIAVFLLIIITILKVNNFEPTATGNDTVKFKIGELWIIEYSANPTLDTSNIDIEISAVNMAIIALAWILFVLYALCVMLVQIKYKNK